MKNLQQELPYLDTNDITNELFKESSILFDIETTGFSAKHSYIYMIGCAYRKEDTMIIQQFFAENEDEESDIIHSFFHQLEDFHSLITFNGLGFDLPYLQCRCMMLDIPMDLSSFLCIDLYKELSSFKHILKVENLKQTTLEKFLAVQREDISSGGDLINIYLDYKNSKNAASLEAIKLHNAEDISGMITLFPLLSYVQFFTGNFYIESYEKSAYLEMDGSNSLEIIFHLKSKYPFPKRISYGFQSFYLSGYKQDVKLKVKVYQGELKYFYSNYKDYYYLPDEDIAIHKSVAFYVDKDFRTRAKAATCYSKKTGCFVPQFEEIFVPYFKIEYRDKHSYVEWTEDVTGSQESLKKYIQHILKRMLINKNYITSE